MKRKNFFAIYLSALFTAGISLNLNCQNNFNQSGIAETSYLNKEKRKSVSKYINIGVGLNNSKFRDFATSPLYYQGSVLEFFLSRLKKDTLRESELGLVFDSGNYKTTFNDNLTKSSVKRIELFYTKSFQLKSLSTNKINTKIGVQINSTGNLRINNSLLNNALGIELFGNLMGSVKVTKDISRLQAKAKKFLFIKYKLIERKRNVSFQLSCGLVNNSYRNGYVYNNQSQIINSPELFGGYVFKVFSGFRMSSRIDYNYYLKNKNALQVSYCWDAYKTGGKLDKFEMAHHVIRFTFLFNTNNH